MSRWSASSIVGSVSIISRCWRIAVSVIVPLMLLLMWPVRVSVRHLAQSAANRYPQKPQLGIQQLQNGLIKDLNGALSYLTSENDARATQI